jgi:hypothetical protein
VYLTNQDASEAYAYDLSLKRFACGAPLTPFLAVGRESDYELKKRWPTKNLTRLVKKNHTGRLLAPWRPETPEKMVLTVR